MVRTLIASSEGTPLTGSDLFGVRRTKFTTAHPSDGQPRLEPRLSRASEGNRPSFLHVWNVCSVTQGSAHPTRLVALTREPLAYM